MSFKLIYTKTAFNDIRKLDYIARKRIKKKIEEFSNNPIIHAKKLVDSVIGEYRWRVGNYRIVFDIDKDKIIILRVGHRKEIYK